MSFEFQTAINNKNLFGSKFLKDTFYSKDRNKLIGLAKTMEEMPVTYGQDGLSNEEKIAYLRYVMKKGDEVVGEWYILEKDMCGGTHIQAFGLVQAGGYPELGYINIEQLHGTGCVFLDLDFKPTTLDKVYAALAA